MESKPQLECAERGVVSCDQLSETVKEGLDVSAVVSADDMADELSKENARLKQKVETLQAILLGSPTHPQGSLQARRARRVSAPAPPPARRLSTAYQPAAIPEFETVCHEDEPCSTTEQLFAPDLTPFQTHQDLHDFTPTPPGTPPDFEEPTVALVEEPSCTQSRQSRPSVVPTLDCSGSRVPRPSTTPLVDCMSSTVQLPGNDSTTSKLPRASTTPRVDCGQDDYDNYDHLTYDDLELLPVEDYFIGEDSDAVADTDADTEFCPDSAPPSPKLIASLKARKSIGKRSRDESVCGVGECVIA